MEQEHVEQRQERPDFLAWVKGLRERVEHPKEEDEGRTWTRLG